jgi:hypothetical protein
MTVIITLWQTNEAFEGPNPLIFKIGILIFLEKTAKNPSSVPKVSIQEYIMLPYNINLNMAIANIKHHQKIS